MNVDALKAELKQVKDNLLDTRDTLTKLQTDLDRSLVLDDIKSLVHMEPSERVQFIRTKRSIVSNTLSDFNRRIASLKDYEKQVRDIARKAITAKEAEEKKEVEEKTEEEEEKIEKVEVDVKGKLIGLYKQFEGGDQPEDTAKFLQQARKEFSTIYKELKKLQSAARDKDDSYTLSVINTELSTINDRKKAVDELEDRIKKWRKLKGEKKTIERTQILTEIRTMVDRMNKHIQKAEGWAKALSSNINKLESYRYQ